MKSLTRDQQELVELHMPEAKRIAVAVWRQSGGDVEELISLAYLGLVESALRYSYDPDVTPFIIYAKPRIRGAIMDAARAVDHVPRSVRTRYKAGDMSVQAQVEAKPVLIDDKIASMLRSRLTVEEEVASNSLPLVVAELVAALPPVHQTVLALHYYANLELREIAEYLGVPDSRVGNIHIQSVMQVLERLTTVLSEGQ